MLLDVYQLSFWLISICFALFERRRQIVLRKRSGTGQVLRIQEAQIHLSADPLVIERVGALVQFSIYNELQDPGPKLWQEQQTLRT